MEAGNPMECTSKKLVFTLKRFSQLCALITKFF